MILETRFLSSGDQHESAVNSGLLDAQKPGFSKGGLT
jgi:hypothetical protein